MKRNLILFSAWLGVLSLAVVLTIYGAWLLYPLEIAALGLEGVTGFSRQVLMDNFHVLLNYLTNPLEWQLSMPDFPSSARGLYHFEAVKKLFHLAQVICLMSLPVLLRVLKPSKNSRFHAKSFLFMSVIPFLVAAFVGLIGFSTFFILFHQVLFPGDSSWLFDPATDPVIRILPEAYFLHCFLLFALIYEILTLGAYAWHKTHR